MADGSWRVKVCDCFALAAAAGVRGRSDIRWLVARIRADSSARLRPSSAPTPGANTWLMKPAGECSRDAAAVHRDARRTVKTGTQPVSFHARRLPGGPGAPACEPT